MLRKLSETFTATHFTILALGATFAPSALYATVATTAVSITDPNLGTKSLVDAARRLWVFDPIAGYQNNPANYVRLNMACYNSSTTGSYTPPSGMAFIVKSIDLSYYNGTSGAENYFYILASDFRLATIESPNAYDSKTIYLGSGFYVRNGETITTNCSPAAYTVSFTGYLVPASQVPTSGAVGQSARVGPAIMKNGRQM